MNRDAVFKHASIGLLWLWLGVFALLPIALIVLASIMEHETQHFLMFPLTTKAYHSLWQMAYVKVFLRSLKFSCLTTLACLIVAYPFAYILAIRIKRYKAFLLLLVIIPFWTSSLLRTYALMILLGAKGIINTLLLKLGLISHPFPMLYTNFAVYLGLIYTLLPFMILPLYTNLEKLDLRLLDAAHDLGASNMTIFRRIILPLSFPGICAGTILVFLPAMTLFYIPDILGGAKSVLVGNLIQNQFIESFNWPQGAATSLILTILIIALMALLNLYNRHIQPGETR